MKPFYFNYILYFRFPLHNFTGEARPHLPPLTARAWFWYTIAIPTLFEIIDQKVIFKTNTIMSFFDKPNYFELFIFSAKILSGKTWELKNFS